MRILFNLFLCLLPAALFAQKTVEVSVTNAAPYAVADAPVAIPLGGYDLAVRSALLTLDGQEIPCQLDDLTGDDRNDELFFLADIPAETTYTYKVSLYDSGVPREYTPRVWAQLMIRSLIIKEENKQDLYLSSLVFEKGIDPFMTVHQHGVAFENEYGAYRVYFDPRQTIDLYGKYTHQLELKETQFYPDAEQKAAGYGDDVLWVGGTFGLGALRGWDGSKATLLDDVCKRGQSVVAYGPLRAIVTVMDKGWTPQGAVAPIDMLETYTIYGGNRAVDVDVTFNRPAEDYTFATGLVNVKGSAEYSDHKGLRGCWGTDWPAGEPTAASPADYKKETVGLAVYVPEMYLAEERPATTDDYTLVLHTDSDNLHYKIMFCSDNEKEGYHSSDEWFAFLAAWRAAQDEPLVVQVKE